jgi:uncharacterized membrane protein HdeD (DUF308 family)
MNCKSCGHENEITANYCEVCGTALTNSAVRKSQVMENKYPGLAKASMILGIISLIFGVLCCFGIFSIILSIGCGVIAIVFAIMSWKSSNRSQAIAGLVCAIIGLILGIIILLIVLNQAALAQWFEQYYGYNPYEGLN